VGWCMTGWGDGAGWHGERRKGELGSGAESERSRSLYACSHANHDPVRRATLLVDKGHAS
jgi:hypothetical protein